MNRITIIAIFITITFQSIGQIEELSIEKIKDEGIEKIIAMVTINKNIEERETLEKIEVQQFEYDINGNCIRKKSINPFIDVVTTSTECFYKFDNKGNKLEAVVIYKTEEITKQDKKFIGALGATNDTTIFRYYYNEKNQLKRKYKIPTNKRDTFITEYTYDNTLLILAKYWTSRLKGQLNPKNYVEKYYYDDFKRLIEIRTIPETLSEYSSKIIEYHGNSSRKKEEKGLRQFNWRATYETNGDKVYNISQDTLNNNMTRYLYDDEGNLLRQISYINEDFYGYEYRYIQGLMIEEQSFKNGVDEVILLTDKINYTYSNKGLLLEKQMIYNGEVKYTYKYQYQSK
jgi:hypothetical protein